MTHLSPDSRIWIYQADRPLTDSEVALCREHLAKFIPGWTAHNQSLKADFDVRYNRFVILCVDETQAGASGCSIDKSVREIKQLEELLHVNFFDRLQIAWLHNNTVESYSKDDMIRLYEQGLIDDNTTVFNNTVLTLADFNTNWQIPYSQSWAYPKKVS